MNVFNLVWKSITDIYYLFFPIEKQSQSIPLLEFKSHKPENKINDNFSWCRHIEINELSKYEFIFERYEYDD